MCTSVHRKASKTPAGRYFRHMNVSLPKWGYEVGLALKRLPAEGKCQLDGKKTREFRLQKKVQTPRQGFRTNKPRAARRPESRAKTESVTRQHPQGPEGESCRRQRPAQTVCRQTLQRPLAVAKIHMGILKIPAGRRFRDLWLQQRSTWKY